MAIVKRGGSCRVLFVARRKNISDVSISFDSASCFLRPAGFSLRLISSCEAPHPFLAAAAALFSLSHFCTVVCVCPWVVRYRTVISSWCWRTRRRETAGRCAPGKRKPGTTSLSEYGGRVEQEKEESCSWKKKVERVLISIFPESNFLPFFVCVCPVPRRN